ncbi:MAG: hypothetical protein OIF40_16285 [Mangrovicoccus sp.]|nr:hypothetical protein [Mangrovicoccus sp.]
MTKTLLTALALCLAPVIATAEGCNWGAPKQSQASSCAEGQVFDPMTLTCTDKVSS